MTYMKNYVQYLADTELKRANGLHPAFASAHEGWAVLLEEIRELSSETHAIEDMHRSEERRVGKECRSRWSPYH